MISNDKARSVLDWAPREVTETIVATAESQFQHGLTLPTLPTGTGPKS